MNMPPCHLIAGPLGVGKTTALLDYLKQNTGREFIAILTNDFGKIGMDSAILKSETTKKTDPVHLVNVPGGCICCTSYAGLEAGLEEIARLKKVDRILVEPSGLTLLESFAKNMQRLCAKWGFEWMPVIAIIDPARTRKAQIENLPYFEQLVHHADILVANRCDRCKPEFLEQFREWSHHLNPPKLQIVETAFGKLPEHLFALRKQPRVDESVSTSTAPSSRHHNLAEISGGKRWQKEIVFDENKIQTLLHDESILRFKGFFQTQNGWRLIQRASEEISSVPATPPKDLRSGAEWILSNSHSASKREVRMSTGGTPQKSAQFPTLLVLENLGQLGLFAHQENLFLTEIPPGKKITSFSESAGLPLRQSCGGKGTCSTCRILLENGHFLVEGKPVFVETGSPINARACQTYATSKDARVRLPHASLLESEGKIAEDFCTQLHPFFPPAEARDGFSVAVDLGTTTVVALLADQKTGEIVARSSTYNAQVKIGGDVASRIAYCTDEKRIRHLQSLLIQETLLPLIQKLLAKTGILPQEISSIALSGNTTMTHLAYGISPLSIGTLPFEPQCRIFPQKPAHDLGLSLFPFAQVRAIPAVSGYVGGDIVADIAVTGLHERAGLHLLIDIGTNGEMVLAENGNLLATATAAGPAFEGSGILHGRRASAGAIDSVCISESDILTYTVIGSKRPLGLCGTAVIDFMAQAKMRGWLSETGRLNRDRCQAAGRLQTVEQHGKETFALILAPAEESGRDDAAPILLTEADIAEVIKAKAAIYAGAKTLLSQQKKTWSDLDFVYLAGGFALHLNLENAITIGLLPHLPIGKYSRIGNGSLAGAYCLTRAPRYTETLLSVQSVPSAINLAETETFEDDFIDALALPHLDPDEFPSA